MILEEGGVVYGESNTGHRILKTATTKTLDVYRGHAL